MAQQARRSPSMPAGVLMLGTRTRLSFFLMLCNFEDRAFEVMHELDSFPASS